VLVLTRKANQSIRIGEIEIFVHKIMGNTVKLAINAPKHMRVLRGELEVFDQGDKRGDN
jgi:carbon storage regulator CsrA